MHTPATVVEPLSPTPGRGVHAADRAWDIGALALVLAGAALFAAARSSLRSLASGTYVPPSGMTFVASADRHVSQSTVALGLIAAGLVVGCIAAARHGWRGRKSR